MKRVSNLDVHVILNDRCLMASVLQKFGLLQGYKNVKRRFFTLSTGLRQSSLLLDHTIYATSSHHYHILPGSTKGTSGLGPIFPARWSHIYWPLLHSGFHRVFQVRVWGRSFILPRIMPYFMLGWPQAIWLNYLHGMVVRNIHQVVG